MSSVQSSVTSDQLERKRPLPEGWVWKTIGDVADTTSGGTPSRKYPEYFQGTIPWVKSGELGDGFISWTEEKITDDALRNSSAKLFPAGTVLVALYGATVGKVGILKIDATSNQAVCALFPRNNSFAAKYMFYWLMSQRQELINKSMGGAQPNISQGIVRSHPFPLAPLMEQERIVARLEELLSDLEAGVAALERARLGVKRYKASVLKVAVEGRLFGEKPEGLPEGWRLTTVGEVADHRLGKMLDKEKNKGEMRPYLRNINVRWFHFDLSDIQYMRVMDSELESISVRKGDLIVCEGGEPGRAAVWNQDKPFVIQKALHRVRLNDEVLPIFLAYRLSTDATTGELERYFTGSTIKHFTGQSLHTYEFPLPPLEEQQRIVADAERRLESARAVESAVEAGLKRAGRLRQAVLRSAFEGRL